MTGTFEIVLQETHSTSQVEHLWEAEWGGKIFCSHGRSNAKGVMTLLPRNSEVQIIQQSRDGDGRLLVLQAKKENSTFVLANVYAPTQDHVEEQIALVDKIEEEVLEMGSPNIMIGGDLNLCMNTSLDRGDQNLSRSSAEGDRYKVRIEALNESLHLSDVWRALHPTNKEFSFRRRRSASRLDYWLCSEHLLDSNSSATIMPYPLSDHAAITIKVGSKDIPTGPGLWKLDNALLLNEGYVTAIQDLLEEERDNPDDLNPCSHWEWVKYRIKVTSRKIAKELKEKDREYEKELSKNYQDIRKQADEGLPYDEESLHGYERELKELHLRKACRAMERSHTTWALEGERPSKYFLNLHKLKARNKTISQLVTDGGRVLTHPRDILAEQKNFFQKLYAQDENSLVITSPSDLGLQREDIPSISETSKASLEENYSEEELRKALGQLNKGKCPGSDGLTVEFFLAFWPLLSPPCFAEVYITRCCLVSSRLSRGGASLILFPKREQTVDT